MYYKVYYKFYCTDEGIRFVNVVVVCSCCHCVACAAVLVTGFLSVFYVLAT